MTEEIKEILDKLKIKNDRYSHHLKYNISYENKDEDYEAHLLLNYITNLQNENEDLIESNHSWQRKLSNYKSRNEKAIEYIKKDTRWFDSEYAKIYGTLCDCEGAKGNRLEVLVNPTNLLNILQGGDE